MTTYPEHFDGHVRLTLLQLLDGQSDGSANDAILYEALNAMDMDCSRDGVRAHIFWLQGQGALHTLDLRMKNGLVVATLTEKGTDIVKGRSAIAGVQRPEV